MINWISPLHVISILLPTFSQDTVIELQSAPGLCPTSLPSALTSWARFTIAGRLPAYDEDEKRLIDSIEVEFETQSTPGSRKWYSNMFTNWNHCMFLKAINILTVMSNYTLIWFLVLCIQFFVSKQRFEVAPCEWEHMCFFLPHRRRDCCVLIHQRWQSPDHFWIRISPPSSSSLH